MKYLYPFLLVLSIACSQSKPVEKEKTPDRFLYLTKPNASDTLCISEINKAKDDVQDGKIVFFQQEQLGVQRIRYEDELLQLCNQNGLEFEFDSDFDLIGRITPEGQTQDCYRNYMDMIISNYYGINFKKQLNKKADSLFLSNIAEKNKIVRFWHCDERPRLPIEKERIKDNLPTIKISSPNIEKSKEYVNGWPFLDIGFIVERDSTISDIYLENYFPRLEENSQFKDELFTIATDHIKTNYPIWVPGIIDGVSVRTDNNVRIYIQKE